MGEPEALDPRLADVVRDAYRGLNEALASGEYGPQFERHLDPAFEYTGPPEVPEPGPYRGYEEFEAFLRFFSDSFEGVVLEIDDLEAAGDGVLLRQRTATRGAGSGAEVADRSWAVATVRDGRLLRIIEDYDRTAALRRAGLEELAG